MNRSRQLPVAGVSWACLAVAVLLLLPGCGTKTVSQSGAGGPGQQGKLTIIGEVEPLLLLKEKVQLPARIDTGAQTSSLDARDITPMERDGKSWVRFTIPGKGGEHTLERPVARTMKVKRHAAKSQKRPVVKLDISLAGQQMSREFSLTDRSQFSYPALIGRNVLQGSFLVDVARKNSSSPLSEAASK